MKFEWDENKEKINVIKHKVNFKEATEVFYDYYAVIFDDIEHSIVEKREILIGYTKSFKLLIVVFTERNNVIRIISARKVTKLEQKQYENNR